MTTLAHHAAMLEIPVDTALLFGGDVYYLLWTQQRIELADVARREASDG